MTVAHWLVQFTTTLVLGFYGGVIFECKNELGAKYRKMRWAFGGTGLLIFAAALTTKLYY